MAISFLSDDENYYTVVKADEHAEAMALRLGLTVGTIGNWFLLARQEQGIPTTLAIDGVDVFGNGQANPGGF